MTGKSILLVEDNAMNRRLVGDILKFRGHSVIEAVSVDEGRRQLMESLPDLVLLDIQVPGGGGETLLEEIRNSERTKQLPVIAITAYAMGGDRERFLKAGFDGYISKPIDVKSFAGEIEKHMK